MNRCTYACKQTNTHAHVPRPSFMDLGAQMTSHRCQNSSIVDCVCIVYVTCG